jgi:hypothetical protein
MPEAEGKIAEDVVVAAAAAPEMVADPPPYQVIAAQLRTGSLIPFLGAAASAAGATAAGRLPTGDELANVLAGLATYPGNEKDPLTKVAQYLEEIPADRGFLLRQIAEIFNSKVSVGYQTAFTRFLARLPRELLPKVIITTNYDSLVENTLQGRNCVVVCQIRKGMNAGQFLCYRDSHAPIADSEIVPATELDDILDDLRQKDPHATVIFKMHGTARMLTTAGEALDSVVLTENDYVDFLVNERSMKIPASIMEALLKANMLFLGYSLRDWNFRVLLRRISAIQAGKSRRKEEGRKHWAILRAPDRVEAKFWEKRNVNLYNLDLVQFLDAFARQLGI